MNYEQRYNDALDRAKKLKENSDSTAVIDGCEQIFPELKESEDEKMRQWIIDDIRYNMNNESLFHSEYKKKAEKAIAWLEKQDKTNIQNNNPLKIESDKFYFCIKDYFAGGCYRSKKGDVVLAKNGMNMMGLSPKQASEYFMPINPFKEHVVVDWFEKEREKPQGKSALEALQEETVDIANEIRPKFKVGDWIICPAFIPESSLLHVINIEDGLYELEDIYGTKKQSTIGHVESIYYHWTIEDATEGDVLCTYECGVPKIVFILKGTPKKPYVLRFHCYYNLMYPYFEPDFKKGCLAPNEEDVKPATKEQRDMLFAKIKESGHEWDADKKELINTL